MSDERQRPSVRRDAGGVQATEDRSDGADAHRCSDRASSAIEAEPHHGRERDLEVECDQPHDRHHEERTAHIGTMPYVGNGRSKVAAGSRTDRPRNEVAAADASEGNEDGDVRNGVGVEARGDAGDRHHHTAQRRADEPCHRHDGAVGGDGARQCLTSDELEEEGLHRRALDGQYQTGHEGEAVDHPQVGVARRHGETEPQRHDCRRGRRHHQQPAVVDPVGEHAGRCSQ